MTRLLAATVLALTMISCGSSSGGGSCGKVEPCGGAVAGSWKASTTCLDQTTVNMSFKEGLMGYCPTATATAKQGSATGTLTLNADLTYSMSVVVPFVFSMSLPASCTNGASCADLAAAIGQSMTDGTVTCTGSGSCNCIVTNTITQNGTGTYTTAGTTLTLDDGSGTPNPFSYCVQGSTLHLVDVDTTMNMGPMGQATITDDVTLTKQ